MTMLALLLALAGQPRVAILPSIPRLPMPGVMNNRHARRREKKLARIQ